MTALSLFGWGTLLGKICKIKFSDENRREEKILMGFFILFLTASTWNLFLPLGKLFAILFLLTGCFLTLIYRKEAKWNKHDLWLIIPLFLFSFFALGKTTVYDAMLYYYDTIQWINEYAVIPGLANIHGRLGFNQFYFYFPALLEAIFPNYGINLANPFLGFLAISFFISLSKNASARWLSALMTGYIASYSLRGELSSASPDTAATFFMLIMLTSFTLQLKEKRDDKFPFFLFLAIICVLTKLSLAVTAGGIVCILFLLEKEKRKSLLCCLPFASILTGLWILRSIYLTGYFVYPLIWPSIAVPWRLSGETVSNEVLSITGWARMPGENYLNAATQGMSYWIKNYFMEKGHLFLTYFRCFTAAVALWLYFAEKRRENFIRLLLLYLPLTAGIIFWWFTAPDPRFAYAILIFFILYPVASAFEKFNCSNKALLIISMTIFLIFFPTLAAPEFLRQLFSTGYSPRPERKYDTKISDHGVVLNITWDMKNEELNKKNLGKNSSSKVPLPSSPYYNANLKLLGNNIQDGFTVQKGIKTTVK